jgi:hypothetical protein
LMNFLAMPWPKPEPEPVIMATLPSRRPGMVGIRDCRRSEKWNWWL